MKYNQLTFAMGIAIAFWNDPIRMQASINSIATGWPGDPYALMVWRQTQMEKIA